MNEHDKPSSNDQAASPKSHEVSRRTFFGAPAAAAASLALPAVLANPGTAQATGPLPASLTPNYYPLPSFSPEVSIAGKIAVITGASRGIGRATAEALIALGVNVIGTSRKPSRVPNRPSYPLLELDISEPNSVRCFVEDVERKIGRKKKVDILINNAGRFVLGNIVPPPHESPRGHVDLLRLGMDTLYTGHVHVTDELLPLMPTTGYARVLFTVSVTGYSVGGTDPITPWIQGYSSAKRALLAYANCLRGMLLQAGSNIKVSTVNPYFVATAGAEHPNPIYLERVKSNGFTDNPPTPTPFNQFLGFIRQRQAAGMPPAVVGQAYAQLLTATSPPPNVVVASPMEPLASQGGTQMIEGILMGENIESALPFSAI